MTTYGVTEDGFVIKPLEVIRQEIDDFQRANIDPGLDLGDRSAQGQINAIHAAALFEMWELGQAVYNSQYPDSANGVSLDNVSSITGTTRDKNTKTIVQGQVTMNPNKALPQGSVAHLANQPNARFVTLAEVPADPVGGVFTVSFEAEQAGAIIVDPNQLTVIAEPVSGWTAVDNADAGVTGSATESDAELRVKREDELEGQGSTNVDSIRADLLRVEGVVDASVFENETDDPDGAGRPPHSVHAILRGGAAAPIAKQLFESKAGGVNTFGSETETVTDSQGNDHDINFDFASQQDFYCAMTIETDPLKFDATNGPDRIKALIAAYVNALRVGGDVIYDQTKCQAFEEVGVVRITVLTIGFVDPPVEVTDLTVLFNQFAVSDVANIDITVT